MQGTRAYLRSLDPHLPRSVWLVQIGGAVNAFGTGMVVPFTLIYLHNVRGISLAAAGGALAVAAGVALIAGIGAGSIVDHVGGRNTLAFGLMLQTVSMALFPARRASGPVSPRSSRGSRSPRRATTPTRCSGSA